MDNSRKKIIATNIRKYIKERGITQKKLAEDIGISPSTLNDYLTLRISPSHGVIQKIADYFEISKTDIDTTWITTESQTPEILKIYNKLNPPRQKYVLNYANQQLAEQEDNSYLMETAIEFEQDGVTQSYDKDVIDFVMYRNYNEGIPMRLSVAKTSAGSGVMLYDDSEMMTIIFPEEEVYDSSATVSGVIVKGDSMQPKYHDGDVLWVDSSRPVESGQIGIFNLNGESYVKKRGQNRLISLNNKYDDILIKEYDDFYTLGKIVDFTPREVFDQIERISWQK